MNVPQEHLNPGELEELNELVGALREGIITNEQIARLDQMLAESPAAMDAFAQMIHLIADLHWHQGGQGGLSPSKTVRLAFKTSPRTWIVAMAASLVLLLSVAGALWHGAMKSDTKRLQAWKTSQRFLSEHPAALLYLDFQHAKPVEGTLPNGAVHAPPNSDVNITGCERVEGRWPGKGCLEFKTPNDGLTVSLPRSFESLTLLAWIRVDRLPQYKQQGILMTKSSEQGALQWYVQCDGSLGLGVQLGATGSPQSWRCLPTPSVIPKKLLGTWIFAACVIDGNDRTVTHYFNGQPMGTSMDERLVPLRLGTVGVGNWPIDPQDRNWVDWRKDGGGSHSINLNGRMDELAVFSSALSAREIRAIYDNTPWGKADLAKQETPQRIK